MPATGVYTRQRRIAMQATMLAVLAVAVGLAALLDRHIHRDTAVSLGPVQTHGSLHFQFPAGWNVAWTRTNPLTAVGLEPHRPSRKFTIYSEHIRRQMSANDYLDNSDILSDIFNDPQSEPELVGDGTLAGYPAICVEGESKEGSEMVLCAVLPDLQTITLCLSKPGKLGAAEDALMDQVSSTVQVDSAPFKNP